MAKFMSPESLDAELEYLRMLVFGAPGTGKTWLGASACLDELTAPALFLDYKSQVATLAKSPRFREAMQLGKLVVLRINKYEELNHVWAWLTGSPRKELEEAFKGQRPKTVVLDSTTELQRSEVLRRAGNPAGQFLTDVQPPEIQDWNTLLNQFSLLSQLFFDSNRQYDLKMHVIFFALEAIDYKQREKSLVKDVTGYRVALQGQAQDQVPANAYTVMRLVKAAPNVPYYNIGYTRQHLAHVKEQVGVFPAAIKGPTIPGMVRLLRGEKREEQEGGERETD